MMAAAEAESEGVSEVEVEAKQDQIDRSVEQLASELVKDLLDGKSRAVYVSEAAAEEKKEAAKQ